MVGTHISDVPQKGMYKGTEEFADHYRPLRIPTDPYGSLYSNSGQILNILDCRDPGKIVQSYK